MKSIVIGALALVLVGSVGVRAQDDVSTLQELREQIRELRARERELTRKLRTLERSRASGDAEQRKGESVRVEAGDEGVKIEIRRKSGEGEEQVESYAAESWDALRKEHPEIAKKYAPGGDKGDLDLRDLGRWSDELRRRLDIDMPEMEDLRGELRRALPIPELQDALKDLNIELPQLRELMEGRLGNGDIQIFGAGRGVQVESTPDGVRVEVQEKNEKGEVETKVYEAASMEALTEKHPELAEKYGIGKPLSIEGFPGLHFRLGGHPGMGGVFGLRDLRGGMPGFPGAPKGPTQLGVSVKVRDDGLEVTEVKPNQLGRELGLEAGDVILSINDEPVRDVESVRPALEKSAGTKVKVRRGEEEKDLEKPAEAPKRRKALKV